MRVEQFITEHLNLWTEAVTTKSSSGRSSNGQVDTTGIKKLRELILELAVRGKLVPQNESDEPAQTLQKRIAAEKARLQADGQIKKTKELPAVAEYEVRFDIPSNWIWTRLGTIAQISPRNTAEEKTEASFVPMPLITTSYTGEHSQEKRQWSAIKKGYTHFADGDIALAKITPCFENSKAAVFRNLHSGIGAGTTELHVARPYGSTIDPFFILCCLKSPGFLIRGEARMTGTAGQKRLPKEFFATDPIPLPPLAEQHRIVQKVDELMALCDRLEQRTRDQHAAHETLVDALLDTLTQSKDADELADNWARLAAHFDTLFTTDRSIGRLKQSILQLAILGRLVPQNPKDEPASILLKNTSDQKTRLAKEGHIKKHSSLPPIPEEERSFEAPAGWKWTRLGEITKKIGSGATPRGGKASYKSEGIPFLRSQNIWNDGLKLNEVAYISPNTHDNMSGTHVCPYDILLNITGASLGRCTIVPADLKQANVSQHVTIIRSIGEVSRDYLHLAILSPYIQKLIWGRQVGMAREGLSKKVLEMFEFPIPPKNEQLRIVEKTNELLTVCDQLKARLNQAGDTRRQMAEAVVEQATH